MRLFAASALCAGIVLSGCAQAPKDVQPGYTTPLIYEGYTCRELGIQAARVSSSIAQLSGYQRRRANWDAVKVAVEIIFVPALIWEFDVEGNGPLSYELARLKGELLAIQKVAIRKSCGFEFRPY